MSERTELDTAADCAPFDRVEHLARQMCHDAGGEWERKGTRRAYWRAKAADVLAEVPDGPDPRLLAGLVLGGVAIGFGLSQLLALVLP